MQNLDLNPSLTLGIEEEYLLVDPETRDLATDPPEALFGGSDGLSYYPQIFARLTDRLTPLGFAAVEMGAGQATSVSRLAKAAGLSVEQVARDYAEIERILVLKPRENHIGAKKTLGIPGGAV